MPHYHGRTLAEIGIEPDDTYRWDICECGTPKRVESELCNSCRARVRAEERARQNDIKLEAIRAVRHALYLCLMTYHGWTMDDVTAHMEQERTRLNKPVRPRFWSAKSGLPK